MKYAVVFAAALAFVALAQAAPVSQNEVETYAFGDLMNGLREKIADLKSKISDVKQNMKQAAGEKKAELKEKLNELQEQLKGALGDLKQALREIFGKNANTYAIDDEDDVYIMDTIKALREKLQEKLELAKTLAEAAKAGGAAAAEEAKKAIATLKEEIANIRADIRKQIKDIFSRGGADTYAVADEEYIIRNIMDGLKEKMAEVKAKIAEVKGQMKDAAGEKKEQLMEKLGELQQELKGAMNDLKAALKEILGRQGSTYAIEGENDVYIMDTIKALREKLQEKLELAKTLAEAAKAGGAMAKDEATKAIAALKEEISRLRQEIRDKIKSILGKN